MTNLINSKKNRKASGVNDHLGIKVWNKFVNGVNKGKGYF